MIIVKHSYIQNYLNLLFFGMRCMYIRKSLLELKLNKKF